MSEANKKNLRNFAGRNSLDEILWMKIQNDVIFHSLGLIFSVRLPIKH